jgi:hypothetical protein
MSGNRLGCVPRHCAIRGEDTAWPADTRAWLSRQSSWDDVEFPGRRWALPFSDRGDLGTVKWEPSHQRPSRWGERGARASWTWSERSAGVGQDHRSEVRGVLSHDEAHEFPGCPAPRRVSCSAGRPLLGRRLARSAESRFSCCRVCGPVVAEGLGLRRQVRKPSRSGACLEKGLAEPGPVLMDFITDPNALSIAAGDHRPARWCSAAGSARWSTWPAATCATPPTVSGQAGAASAVTPSWARNSSWS